MTQRPEDRLSVRFWGVRGSLPAPGPETVRYGGETTCLEVRLGTRRVIVDCGSGARRLGKHLMAEGPSRIDLVFTHSHMDHICGLPFFLPAYDPAFRVRLWAGHLPTAEIHRDIIERLMSPPIFPVPTAALQACAFGTFRAGDPFEVEPGLVLDTCRLHHPGGATGYGFRHAGRRLVVVTDHEHGNPEVDAAVERFVAGADVMVYDAMYTDEEYPKRVGWGHSTWQKAIELAERAGVAVPVIMHHDPSRSDDALDAIQTAMAARLPLSLVAREGLEVNA